MDDYIWLIEPIHKNRFLKVDINDEAIKPFIKTSFDGSIMAVTKEKVESAYFAQNVPLVRSGYQKMPDNMKIEDADSFYSYLAYFIDL